MDPNMNGNSDVPAAKPTGGSPVTGNTTMAETPIKPGLSGRTVAIALGSFIAFSIAAIPLGLLQYQRLSDREKRIQSQWPPIAAKLETGYEAIDQALLKAIDENRISPFAYEKWTQSRQQFRRSRRWVEQLQASQVLERHLSDVDRKSLATQPLLETLLNGADGSLQRDLLLDTRRDSLNAADQFYRTEIATYRDALHSFPGNAILLFVSLPEPPECVFSIPSDQTSAANQRNNGPVSSN